jgi:hypothetical protein
MGVEDNDHHVIDTEDEDGERVASSAQPSFLQAPDHMCVLQTDADFRKDQSVNAEDLSQQRKVLLLNLLPRVQEKGVPTQASVNGNKVQYGCNESLNLE